MLFALCASVQLRPQGFLFFAQSSEPCARGFFPCDRKELCFARDVADLRARINGRRRGLFGLPAKQKTLCATIFSLRSTFRGLRAKLETLRSERMKPSVDDPDWGLAPTRLRAGRRSRPRCFPACCLGVFLHTTQQLPDGPGGASSGALPRLPTGRPH